MRPIAPTLVPAPPPAVATAAAACRGLGCSGITEHRSHHLAGPTHAAALPGACLGALLVGAAAGAAAARRQRRHPTGAARHHAGSVVACAAGSGKLIAGPRAVASPGFKTVHFVRHAEAWVNAAGRVFPKDDPRKKAVRLDPKWFDAKLSLDGLAQCAKLRKGTLEGRDPPPKVELVAVSPLTRALQTATEVFGCAEKDGPRTCALEGLREFCSKDFQPCDSRRPPEDLEKTFPHVDFSEVPSGADALLGPGRVESAESADARIRGLFAWIRAQPEKEIACVAHFQILSRILAVHLEPAGWDGSDYGSLGNLDIRSVPVAFE